MWTAAAALAIWVGTAVPAFAQHRGGGGGHGGGGHAGGVHSGSFHSGNFHSGNFHSGNFHHDGHHHGSVIVIGGFYGGYPYYGGYGYRSPYYGGYGYGYGSTYVSPSTVYYNDYGPSANIVPVSPDVTTTRSAYYAPEADNKARIHVRIPADATLWIDGDPTQQTGAERDFVTPPLTPGSTFTYTMKARWMQGNDPVERTIKVDVRANATSQADFMR
jgi:uncharacterized protein (TIGR03000 family)